MTQRRWWGLGQRVAPPRFILFVLVFAGAFALGLSRLEPGRAVMGAFDLAAFVFLASVATLLDDGQAERMRAATRENDANRAVLLAVTGVTMLVILAAVAGELKGKNDGFAILLVIVTLALCWLFSNTVYALHYAHLFYMEADGGDGDAGGLSFPDTKTPDYWDFLYFACTLGMTFQTSDVGIGSRRIRRVVLGHCLAAFVFNLGIIAFSINVLGGG